MHRKTFALACLTWAAALAACAAPPRGIAGSETGPALRVERTLSVVLRNEPFDLTDSASSRNRITVAMFTAGLVTEVDDVPRPVLAETAPELNTDTWRVFPDGRMETVYRLKPGLTWHDGAPLTAEDFVFARRVGVARVEWGVSVPSAEHRAIQEVVAADDRTVVVRWRQPFPDAIGGHKPLPRHILGPVLEQGQSDVFVTHAYWTTEFISAGPYRLGRWEQGAFLEGLGFDGYALGRPRIDRVAVTWSTDPNVTLARMLAGDAHVTMDDAIQFQQAVILRRDWVARGDGQVLFTPTQLRQFQAQHRPAYANPDLVLDARVRRATAHALDRKALADAMLEGEGLVAETIAPPTLSFYAAIERAARTYPFDLRRAEQALAEVGFTRGSDGFFASPTAGRYAPEVLGIAEGQEGQETTIIADALRRNGIDTQLRLVPSVQIQQDDEMKATFPAWRTNYIGSLNKGLGAERQLASRIASPADRWSGTNKYGWNNPEHDRLHDQWNSTLDRAERNRLMVEIVRVTMEELPYIPLYWNFEVIAHSTALRGPQLGNVGTSHYWNVHLWEWVR